MPQSCAFLARIFKEVTLPILECLLVAKVCAGNFNVIKTGLFWSPRPTVHVPVYQKRTSVLLSSPGMEI